MMWDNCGSPAASRGVMRLGPGVTRELYWHPTSAEWPSCWREAFAQLSVDPGGGSEI
jgi:hypothetical protein